MNNENMKTNEANEINEINEAVLEGMLFVVGEDGLTINQIEDVLGLDNEEAKRLINMLKMFLPIPSDDIPKDSILREFIGGGCFRQ